MGETTPGQDSRFPYSISSPTFSTQPPNIRFSGPRLPQQQLPPTPPPTPFFHSLSTVSSQLRAPTLEKFSYLLQRLRLNPILARPGRGIPQPQSSPILLAHPSTP